jgi:hypothetical protein
MNKELIIDLFDRFGEMSFATALDSLLIYTQNKDIELSKVVTNLKQCNDLDKFRIGIEDYEIITNTCLSYGPFDIRYYPKYIDHTVIMIPKDWSNSNYRHVFEGVCVGCKRIFARFDYQTIRCNSKYLSDIMIVLYNSHKNMCNLTVDYSIEIPRSVFIFNKHDLKNIDIEMDIIKEQIKEYEIQINALNRKARLLAIKKYELNIIDDIA